MEKSIEGASQFPFPQSNELNYFSSNVPTVHSTTVSFFSKIKMDMNIKKKKLADFWKKRHVREANVLLSHRLRPSTDWATGHRGIPPTPKPTRAISLPFSPFAFLGFSNPPKPYDSNPPNTFDEKLLTKPRNKSRNLEWRHYGIQNSPTISNFCSIPRFFFIKNL